LAENFLAENFWPKIFGRIFFWPKILLAENWVDQKIGVGGRATPKSRPSFYTGGGGSENLVMFKFRKFNFDLKDNIVNN